VLTPCIPPLKIVRIPALTFGSFPKQEPVDAVPVSVASSGSAEFWFARTTGACADFVVGVGLFPAALMQPALMSVLTQ
jgi:hypothetical protein